jgi:hypothetical protein
VLKLGGAWPDLLAHGVAKFPQRQRIESVAHRTSSIKAWPVNQTRATLPARGTFRLGSRRHRNGISCDARHRA